LVFVLKLPKKSIDEISNLPLEEDMNIKEENHE